jgi:hypothetical protein
MQPGRGFDIYHLNEVSATSLYFAALDLQETIASCFTNAKVKGTGAAINQLQQSLG